MKPSIAVLLALPLVCASCATGISVTQVTDDDRSVTGIPWNLAMTQFAVTITRQVAGCGSKLTGSVQLTITPSKVADIEQRYALASNGVWATSDITANLAPDGTTTGLNATSADSTATVISNVVSTIGQILIGVASVAPAPPAPGAPSPPPPPDVCSDAVLKALSDMNVYPAGLPGTKTLKQQVDDGTAALTAATQKVTMLTAQVQLDKTYKPILAQALADQATAQAKLSADQDRLMKDLKVVSDTQLVNWPLRGDQFQTLQPFVPDGALIRKWMRDPNAKDDDIKAAQAQFGVYLAMFRQKSTDGKWETPPSPQLGDVSVGVPVRLARVGRLVACKGQPSADSGLPSACSPGKIPGLDDQLSVTDQLVLQLGRMYNVPVRGGTFKSEGAVIALDANTGLPTSIEVSEKVAAAAALSGSAKDTATQLAALPGQVAAARLAATQAQTNQYNAQAALITAVANAQAAGQIAPLAAQAAVTQAQTTQMTNQTALATAVANAQVAGQVAPLAAQAALNTANANVQTTLAALVAAQANSQVVDQTSALAAQTSLLNAEVARLNAQAALTKAQALP